MVWCFLSGAQVGKTSLNKSGIFTLNLCNFNMRLLLFMAEFIIVLLKILF